jgi:general secretion pathway protein F
VGGAMRLAETARFLNHLGLMLRHRVPMNEAVGLLADSATNGYTKAALLDFEQRLTRGESLGALVGKQPIFPPTLAIMIASAQERGQLDETLIELSGYYRHRADHALRVLREFFEPVMMVVAGVVVIWIAISIYLPMMNIPRLVM